jgi:lipoprotein NlpD
MRWSAALGLALLLLAGCGSAPQKAPVREAGKKVRPVAAVPAGPARPSSYRVQAGDTLYKIAFENGLDYQDLAAWNRLADPNLIRVGEDLRLIPPSEAVKTTPLAQPLAAGKAIDTKKPEPAPGASLPPIPSEDTELPPGQWVWPVKGEVVTRFNEGEGSKGIDVANRRGTPVLAAAAGRVVYAGSGLRGYGKMIIIKHSKTLLSAYGHNDQVYVQEGQKVAQSQVIARMGDSDAERVKLHFEIREQGRPVDPINYLPNIGGERWGVE